LSILEAPAVLEGEWLKQGGLSEGSLPKPWGAHRLPRGDKSFATVDKSFIYFRGLRRWRGSVGAAGGIGEGSAPKPGGANRLPRWDKLFI